MLMFIIKFYGGHFPSLFAHVTFCLQAATKIRDMWFSGNTIGEDLSWLNLSVMLYNFLSLYL